MPRSRIKGFSMIEIMVVLGIVAVIAAVGFWALQNRSGHYRVRGGLREMLQMLRLAQANAIRSNTQHRIRFISTTQYNFEANTAGTWGGVSGTTRLTQINTVPNGVTFTGIIGTMNCATYPCQSPLFNADGTITPGGTMGLTDGKERLDLQWTIGGAIRVK